MSANRRTFLKQLGALGLVSLSGRPPAFLGRAALAAEEQRPQPDHGRILVLVQLAGGNDGLNTVVPYGDPEYRKARPGIAIPEQAVLKIDDRLGLHPQMTGLKELYDDGMLAVVQGVGYPNPDRSHFRSMDIWHSARPKADTFRDGWLGRALEQTADERAGNVPALALGTDQLPLALTASKLNVPAVRDLDSFHLRPGPAGGPQGGPDPHALRELARRPAEDGSELQFLRRSLRTAVTTAERLKQVTASYRPAASYPQTGLGGRLKTIAQMIAGDFGTRIFFVSLGGFDTHSQQAGAHQALLSELASAVRAFFEDLKGHGLADRVLLMTFSEFGRRVHENGSLGTDHGAASQMFVVSPNARPGLHGEHPSLTDLDRGDLKFHTDFRSVYATLLSRWLALPSEPVLGGTFPLLDFVRTG